MNANPENPFDRARLVHELLSLGNERITHDVAHLIGREVEEELSRHPSPRVSAELISEIVEFKLRELGLMDLSEPDPSWNEDEETNSLSEVEELHPEEFKSLSNRIEEVLKNGKNTELKTLEKFLRPIEETRPFGVSLSPPPPQATLKISERGLEKLCQKNKELKDHGAAREYLRARMENIAQVAASAEAKFSSKINPQTLAVEFFNTMANQEFYPHLPSLLGETDLNAYGGNHLTIDLPLGSASQEIALNDAQTIWKEGGSVTFAIDTPGKESPFTRESFEEFLDAVEKSILDLPESVGVPQSVGILLSSDNPLTPEFLRLALSGKYYPKFSFTLALPKKRDPLLGEEIDLSHQTDMLKEFWGKNEPHFIFPEEIRASIGSSEGSFPEIPRRSGGPKLFPYEICHLGSLNVAILATGSEIDWTKLRRMVRSAVHFLDNLFEVTEYPLESVARQSLNNRKIGLGIMGFADLLVKLGYPYDSENSMALAEKLMRFIKYESLQASQGLARERAVFPGYSGSIWKEKGYLLRNASLNAIAPTPFLADIAGVTPGAAPLESILETTPENDPSSPEPRPIPLLKKICEQRKIWSTDLESEILESQSVRLCTPAPKPLRKLFPIREEISMAWQQRVQAAFQKHCDGANRLRLKIPETEDGKAIIEVLKFTNEMEFSQIELNQNPLLKEDPPKLEEEILEDTPQNPRSILSNEVKIERKFDLGPDPFEAKIFEMENPKPPKQTLKKIEPRKRPDVLKAVIHQIQTGYGPMRVTIGYDELGPIELTAILGTGGSHEGSNVEAISRLTTLLLSVGVEPKLIFEQLKGIRCPTTATDKGEEILSCGDAIAKVLDREFHLAESEEEEITIVEEKTTETQPLKMEEAEEEITAVIGKEILH